ncbi:porin family protein [Psychrobium sp. MM17-31]|uniref:outer membrane beta-barrel protein n=1 Tax=Psychrobium sp. MM17-31 TaxID=2917758 RepID=UPI001EF71520|nr:outer membrane beta-barrel protein [Psychrobium sp. MM17-31]MCG7533154.1 porin family protein [Psychrobium sp. MM17-31]
MKKLLLGSALLLAFSQVSANEGPKWDSLTVAYQDVDLAGIDVSGFSFSGSKLVNDNVFVFGNLSMNSDTIGGVDFDLDTTSLGLGYRHGFSAQTDFFGTLSYEKIETEVSGRGLSESADGNGYGLSVGVRSMVTDKVELLGSIGYLDIEDDSEGEFTLGASYHFTDNFSMGLHYNKIDEMKTTSLSASWNF